MIYLLILTISHVRFVRLQTTRLPDYKTTLTTWDSSAQTGCSLAVALIHQQRNQKKLYMAHVGNTGIFLARKNRLTQLNLEHTYQHIMPILGKMLLDRRLPMCSASPGSAISGEAVGPRGMNSFVASATSLGLEQIWKTPVWLVTGLVWALRYRDQ